MKNNEWIYGYHALKAVLTVRPEAVLNIYLQSNRDDERVQEIKNLADSFHIHIQTLPPRALEERINSSHHQGMIAECKTIPAYTERDLKFLLEAQTTPYLILILDGVQDPHNLGACLRTANAMGVQMVIIPKDRSARLTPAVKKVASGAAELTPLVVVTNLARTLRDLKKEGIWLIGTASEADTSIDRIDLTGSIGLVMGGEENGLRSLTRKECDYLAKIPMSGSVDSLNVSVATGMCLYEVKRQRG